MDASPGYQVKQIVVDPGKRISHQWHHHRAEHWVVVQGMALVTIGTETKEVSRNESVFVPLTPPIAWRTLERSRYASSKSKPALIWEKMTSCAWKMISGGIHRMPSSIFLNANRKMTLRAIAN